jgi:sugar fermentation stimulation protein A
VRYKTELVEAEFLLRENRFVALVDILGKKQRVHVPNTGRMRELLVQGNKVLLLEAKGQGRRTPYDLVAVETPEVRVSVDSRVPNEVFSEAVEEGSVPMISTYDRVRREHTWGSSRFDFHLQGPAGEALVEVKGCTLVEEDGLALFPDAPTLRGARHVNELADAYASGMEAFLVIIVQRDDGRMFAPNDRTDRAFGDAMRAAAEAGVEVMAFSTDVTREGVDLGGQIPVDLTAALEGVP